MEKHDLLSMITQFAARGLVKKDEVVKAYNDGAVVKENEKSKGERIANVLYLLGAAVIFIGIMILIWQNWEDLNDFTRVLATLGIGICMYGVGAVLGKDEKHRAFSNAFLVVSLLVIPSGLFILHDILGFEIDTPGMSVWIASIMIVLCLVSGALMKSRLFSPFGIMFGTWFYFALIALIVDVAGYNPSDEFIQYEIMAAAISFLSLGYFYRVSRKDEYLGGALLGIGAFVFLGTALGLGGWAPDENIFWELIYPLLVFGFIFASVYMRVRQFLIMGSLYLMAFTVKISFEYFADSLGWPLVLVLLGLILMGVGYGTFYLDRKYVKEV